MEFKKIILFLCLGLSLIVAPTLITDYYNVPTGEYHIPINFAMFIGLVFILCAFFHDIKMYSIRFYFVAFGFFFLSILYFNVIFVPNSNRDYDQESYLALFSLIFFIIAFIMGIFINEKKVKNEIKDYKSPNTKENKLSKKLEKNLEDDLFKKNLEDDLFN